MHPPYTYTERKEWREKTEGGREGYVYENFPLTKIRRQCSLSKVMELSFGFRSARI